MLRVTAAPERFLSRGLAQWLARRGVARRPSSAHRSVVALPPDLVALLSALGGRRVGDLTPKELGSLTFASVLRAARRGGAARARLVALLAGALPFGTGPAGTIWVYVLDGGASPARSAIVAVDTETLSPRVVCRGAAAFAVRLALVEAERDDALATRAGELLAKLPSPGVAEQEAVRTAFERARAVADLLVADDPAVRRAAKRLVHRPLAVPHPPRSLRSTRGRTKARRPAERTDPFALGSVVEAFFRTETGDADLVGAHAASPDAIVRDAVSVLEGATREPSPRTALGKDLARRRVVATRAAKSKHAAPASVGETRLELTRRIVERIDALRPVPDPGAATAEREEALLALGELGDGGVLPSLLARALTGDVAAVDMLGALGDVRAIPHLLDLLRRPSQGGLRLLETAAVRALTDLRARDAADTMRELLEQSPLSGWREGIERGALVRELVGALGTLRDEAAAPVILQILESKSNEYRHVLPVAAWAMGRLRHLPALPALERLVFSPKEASSSEAVWAIGELGSAHPSARERVTTVLRTLPNVESLEPGVDIVRLTGLAKTNAGTAAAPTTSELRRGLERALWDPAFRQEETSRRQAWALRSLAELARVWRESYPDEEDHDAFFLGHEAVRYFVTRDDHRVRTSAEAAFAAWGAPLPRTRRYYSFVLDAIEERGGLEALHDAVRDPLGVFRHNVATRLAERGHPSSVRPLAEAAARLFAEPATSTYEYDDAPLYLVTFVRALARLNRPEGNAVLLEGLRSAHHHVRAVIADNAPDDPAFVPELMAMLGDPRSFLRSRAERSLRALGIGTTSPSERPPPRTAPL